MASGLPYIIGCLSLTRPGSREMSNIHAPTIPKIWHDGIVRVLPLDPTIPRGGCKRKGFVDNFSRNEPVTERMDQQQRDGAAIEILDRSDVYISIVVLC